MWVMMGYMWRLEGGLSEKWLECSPTSLSYFIYHKTAYICIKLRGYNSVVECQLCNDLSSQSVESQGFDPLYLQFFAFQTFLSPCHFQIFGVLLFTPTCSRYHAFESSIKNLYSFLLTFGMMICDGRRGTASYQLWKHKYSCMHNARPSVAYPLRTSHQIMG